MKTLTSYLNYDGLDTRIIVQEIFNMKHISQNAIKNLTFFKCDLISSFLALLWLWNDMSVLHIEIYFPEDIM